MGFYLFDSIRLGIIAAVVAETIILLWWTFSRGRLHKIFFLIGPALAGLFLLLDFAVETNRETLERLTREIVQAVEDENATAMIDMISDNIQLDNGMDKTKVSAIIQRKLAQPIVENNRISKLMVTQALDSDGQVEFTVITHLDAENPAAIIPLFKSTWRFDYSRQNGQYKLQNITNLKFNNSAPIDIFRYRWQ
jgi:hypothetical protein